MKQNQLGRKIELIKLLQTGVAATADQLAQVLGISKRTVFRDIRALEDAGIEVRFDKPRQSYRISPHFGLPLPALTSDDVAVIVAAAHLSPLYANTHYWGQIQRTTGKLLEKLSLVDRQGVQRLIEGLDLNPQQHGHQQRAVQDKVLHSLVEAIRRGHPVRLTYYDHDSKQQQTLVKPEKLGLSQGGWLLKGRSSWHRGPHQFDVSRILKAEPAATSSIERPGKSSHLSPSGSSREKSVARR